MRGTTTSSMRAGLPPGWTTADKTGSRRLRQHERRRHRLRAGRETRAAVDHDALGVPRPRADGLRPLIGELTTLAIPWLINSD